MCALRGSAETAFRLLRRCRSVQGADAPCAVCAAIPFSNGRFPGTVGNSPRLVKLNIVLPIRPFVGFSGKRSFLISGLNFERSGALEESLEKLRQEYEDAKVKAAQYKNQVTRLQNRLNYKENRTRKERAHRLITKGAAIESIVPTTKDLSEVEFYALMEKVFALPEVTGVIERDLKGDG